MFADGTVVTDKLLMSKKKLAQLGQPIEILEFDRPEHDYIVLESVTLQNIRIVHVINMDHRKFIRVGRGHDADIRVTDISVSRFHARINKSLQTGEYFVEDNKSKFGTLVQIRKPMLLQKNICNYIQMGRTSLKIEIADPEQAVREAESTKNLSCCSRMCSLFNKTAKSQLEQQQQLELYPAEWDSDSELTDDEKHEHVLNT